MPQNNEIAILDFGSQYTHLIARRIRELGVISHIYHNDVSAGNLKSAVGIILSGGPKSIAKGQNSSPHQKSWCGELAYNPAIFNLNLPILGLCYGHQLIAKHFGGKVSSGLAREYGLAKMKINQSPIFKNIKSRTIVWMSHGDHVDKLPPDFKQIAHTSNRSIAAMSDEKRKIYGFQFHPEVNHTKEGKQTLKNFVFNICGAKKNWTTETMLEDIQENIKTQAGDKNVFLLVSGGVDSTVCFALLEKTLGKNRIYGLLVDHGLMRQNEARQVKNGLNKIGLNNLHIYDAEKEYLKTLKNIADPEQKRKIIGDLFLDIADRVMKQKKMTSDNWLIGQGTIYPDTIESGGTKNADIIKTHHNRVPRVQQMIAEQKIIEPIKELYKDEVRQIGLKLGLPKNILFRHPFPGPGLGIRCLCNVIASPKGVAIPLDKGNLNSLGLRSLSRAKTRDPAPRNDIYKLPIKSVGVQGDERSYAHPALIIPLTPKINWQFYSSISPRITNQHKDINRVLFLLHGDKTQIINSALKTAYLTKTRLDLLRKIDGIVNKHILKNKQCEHIWQLPVVLIPFGYNKGESIVLRPVESEEAMTVSFAKISQKILDKIIKEITKLAKIDFIFYDITNKPPGTIEWE